MRADYMEACVLFSNYYAHTSDAIPFGALLQALEIENITISRTDFFNSLKAIGLLDNELIPTAEAIEDGILIVKNECYETAYGTLEYPHTFVTGKGQIFIVEYFRDMNNTEVKSDEEM